jgi:hypothetical protein
MPDLNVSPSGLTRDYVAGEPISANDVVALYLDGKVYRASLSYRDIVGVAMNSANKDEKVRVLVMGVATVVADEAIRPGDLVTFSPRTPGRVVKYLGHAHAVSSSTAPVVDSVSTTTTTVVGSISTTTGTFVTGISVDKRDFTTTPVLSDVETSTGSFVTDVGLDTGYTVDSAGYIRHTHEKSTASAVTDITKSRATVVTGITPTAGKTVVADVSASTGSAVTGISATPATVVSGVSTTTTQCLTYVAVLSELTRVLGMALTRSDTAGQRILVLVMPSYA